MAGAWPSGVFTSANCGAAAHSSASSGIAKSRETTHMATPEQTTLYSFMLGEILRVAMPNTHAPSSTPATMAGAPSGDANINGASSGENKFIENGARAAYKASDRLAITALFAELATMNHVTAPGRRLDALQMVLGDVEFVL